jgi:hypothetical protein
MSGSTILAKLTGRMKLKWTNVKNVLKLLTNECIIQ